MVVATAEALLVLVGLLIGGEADPRRAKVDEVLSAVRVEVARISPHIEGKVPWGDIERDLLNSATPPARWLARAFVLVVAFCRNDWPTGEKLALLRRWYAGGNPVVRLLVVKLLVRMDEAGEAGVDLRSVARDTDPRVRLVVARSLLGRRDDPAAFDTLLELLFSGDGQVRSSAVGLDVAAGCASAGAKAHSPEAAPPARRPQLAASVRPLDRRRTHRDERRGGPRPGPDGACEGGEGGR